MQEAMVPYLSAGMEGSERQPEKIDSIRRLHHYSAGLHSPVGNLWAIYHGSPFDLKLQLLTTPAEKLYKLLKMSSPPLPRTPLSVAVTLDDQDDDSPPRLPPIPQLLASTSSTSSSSLDVPLTPTGPFVPGPLRTPSPEPSQTTRQALDGFHNGDNTAPSPSPQTPQLPEDISSDSSSSVEPPQEPTRTITLYEGVTRTTLVIPRTPVAATTSHDGVNSTPGSPRTPEAQIIRDPFSTPTPRPVNVTRRDRSLSSSSEVAPVTLRNPFDRGSPRRISRSLLDWLALTFPDAQPPIPPPESEHEPHGSVEGLDVKELCNTLREDATQIWDVYRHEFFEPLVVAPLATFVNFDHPELPWIMMVGKTGSYLLQWSDNFTSGEIWKIEEPRNFHTLMPLLTKKDNIVDFQWAIENEKISISKYSCSAQRIRGRRGQSREENCGECFVCYTDKKLKEHFNSLSLGDRQRFTQQNGFEFKCRLSEDTDWVNKTIIGQELPLPDRNSSGVGTTSTQGSSRDDDYYDAPGYRRSLIGCSLRDDNISSTIGRDAYTQDTSNRADHNNLHTRGSIRFADRDPPIQDSDSAISYNPPTQDPSNDVDYDLPAQYPSSFIRSDAELQSPGNYNYGQAVRFNNTSDYFADVEEAARAMYGSGVDGDGSSHNDSSDATGHDNGIDANGSNAKIGGSDSKNKTDEEDKNITAQPSVVKEEGLVPSAPSRLSIPGITLDMRGRNITPREIDIDAQNKHDDAKEESVKRARRSSSIDYPVGHRFSVINNRIGYPVRISNFDESVDDTSATGSTIVERMSSVGRSLTIKGSLSVRRISSMKPMSTIKRVLSVSVKKKKQEDEQIELSDPISADKAIILEQVVAQANATVEALPDYITENEYIDDDGGWSYPEYQADVGDDIYMDDVGPAEPSTDRVNINNKFRSETAIGINALPHSWSQLMADGEIGLAREALNL